MDRRFVFRRLHPRQHPQRGFRQIFFVRTRLLIEKQLPIRFGAPQEIRYAQIQTRRLRKAFSNAVPGVVAVPELFPADDLAVFIGVKVVVLPAKGFQSLRAFFDRPQDSVSASATPITSIP